MSIGSRVFASIYDRMGAKVERAGLSAIREQLLLGATGDVLEIGGGTGANLPFYGDGVTTLTVTEPEPPMLRRLERRVAEQGSAARVLRAPAEDIPFDARSFDTVVSTLVLCGVDDQPRALREIRRVLRPGGRFLFVEHVRSADDGLARLQDRMNGINRVLARCECNRQTLDSIRASGFDVTSVLETTLPRVPRFVSPLVVGTATPA